MEACRKRFLIQKLALSCLSIISSLLIAEVGLRISGYSAPMFRKTHPILGWTLYPGIEGYHRIENSNYLRINSAGQNAREYSVRKPANTYRIAVLGDSFAQAGEVPLEKNFCTLLEEILSAELASKNKQVEVINFAAVGYGTAQEYLTLQEKVWPYDVDLVLLIFFAGNDVSDNHYDLNPTIRDLRPYFLVKNGELAADPSFPNQRKLSRNALVIKAVNHSRLLQLLKEFSKRRHGWTRKGEKPLTPALEEKDKVYLSTQPGNWREAWEITILLIGKIQEEVKKNNRTFALVSIPEAIRVHPDYKVRLQFQRLLGVPDLDFPDRQLLDLSTEYSIPFLPLAAELAFYAQKHQEYLYGFTPDNLGTGHLNEKGHQVTAKVLGTWLLDLINS